MEMKNNTPVPEVRPLNVELLGKPVHLIREKLETIISGSCNKLATELQNWLKNHQIDVKLEFVELHWLKPADIDKHSVTQFKHQDGGTLFVSLENTTLVKLADRFYAADVERQESTLTSSDLRLQERIGKLVSQWIAPGEMWEVSESEIGSDVGLRAVATIKYGDHAGHLALIIESNLVQTLINELNLDPAQDLSPQLHRSLEATPVRLNVLLSKKTLPLSDVLSLKPDDILPIELLSTVPVNIGNEHLFSGRVFEQEGQLVLTLNPTKESQR
ncbi:FliM/FliN family flagellar motor switch protein [Vibrio quintilis]|uniref:Flagellar motor switch protein FliM n=1 Tax=Vibrio quintilis TaxID=1117707 RepID=A0A1M7YSV8_9VIBR|nr:FliM/FliN family flagellar motor C-terminal domain-containing protein [Vibrio quintilis]SHO55698.1 flagellar motor switch protein FliM [Vibrio quintilis]